MEATNAALLDVFIEYFGGPWRPLRESARLGVREAQELLALNQLMPAIAAILREAGEDPSVLDDWLEASRTEEILRRCRRARDRFGQAPAGPTAASAGAPGAAPARAWLEVARPSAPPRGR